MRWASIRKQVIKLSGIGCSSKSPAYFLGGSHGFNAVHGRMPSVGTGAMLANQKLIAIGVSGDGDTGAIGIGQFVHLMRRNLPIIYIIEDNGCYGLTKGQFSPTADVGSKLKNGVVNDLQPIDTCALAIQLGATFVARSFSGDKKQLLALLKAALSHRGTVMLDVISPCVTFNDHEGSTKSYAYVKDHDDPLEEVSFVPFFEDISVEYDPGTTQEVKMHDGSRLFLKKLEESYDPTDKLAAMRVLHETTRRGEFATGLIYIEPDRDDFLRQLNVVDEPLASLPLERTARPRPRSTRLWRAFADPGQADGMADGISTSFCPPAIIQRPDDELPLRLVRVRPNHILGNRQPILGQPVAVEGARRVLVALLFVRRTVTFDRAFVLIRVSWFRAELALERRISVSLRQGYIIGNFYGTNIRHHQAGRHGEAYTGKILQRIEEAGFRIRAMKTLRLTQTGSRGLLRGPPRAPVLQGASPSSWRRGRSWRWCSRRQTRSRSGAR